MPKEKLPPLKQKPLDVAKKNYVKDTNKTGKEFYSELENDTTVQADIRDKAKEERIALEHRPKAVKSPMSTVKEKLSMSDLSNSFSSSPKKPQHQEKVSSPEMTSKLPQLKPKVRGPLK